MPTVNKTVFSILKMPALQTMQEGYTNILFSDPQISWDFKYCIWTQQVMVFSEVMFKVKDKR